MATTIISSMSVNPRRCADRDTSGRIDQPHGAVAGAVGREREADRLARLQRLERRRAAVADEPRRVARELEPDAVDEDAAAALVDSGDDSVAQARALVGLHVWWLLGRRLDRGWRRRTFALDAAGERCAREDDARAGQQRAALEMDREGLHGHRTSCHMTRPSRPAPEVSRTRTTVPSDVLMYLSSSPETPPLRLLMNPGAAGIAPMRRALVFVACVEMPVRLM